MPLTTSRTFRTSQTRLRRRVKCVGAGMHIPDEPPIGNLVAYEYLWLSQHSMREDGAKVYPVALIFAKKIIASATLAYAVGMSHKPPDASEKAIEVPCITVTLHSMDRASVSITGKLSALSL